MMADIHQTKTLLNEMNVNKLDELLSKSPDIQDDFSGYLIHINDIGITIIVKKNK
jgi:hypothetical protein